MAEKKQPAAKDDPKPQEPAGAKEPQKAEKNPAPVVPAPPPTPAPAAPPATFSPVPPPPQETLLVPVSSEPARQAPPPAEPTRKTALQGTIETVSVLVFLALTLIPLARFGVIEASAQLQINVLIGSSFVLVLLTALFPAARFKLKRLGVEAHLDRQSRGDLAVHSLSVAAMIVQILILLVEVVAFLVYRKLVRSTGEAVVAAADNFVLFATFALLLLDMLLIARTSFDVRYKGRSWHPRVSRILLAFSSLLLILALLKNLDQLNLSVFRGLKPDQSSYILVLAVLFQLVASKMLLRYPPIGRIILGQLEQAKKATHADQDVLRRKAYTAYILGLLFVVVTMFFLGGVSTGNIATGTERTTNFLLIAYLSVGGVLIGILLTRFIQQRWIQERERRRASGDPIARRRRTKEETNRLVLFFTSGFLALVFFVAGVMAFAHQLPLKPKYGTDLFILSFLTGVAPYGFWRTLQVRRIRAMDDKFPDFLRDLAEGQRAGMTLPRALLSASKGVYGALTPEIKHMSAQVEWGVSFTEALQRFSKRVKTPLIERAVALIIEASNAGGNVVDILTAASTDAREIKQIIEERRRQMGIYSIIIYVAFFVFLTVIFVLAAQFLPSFQEAVKGASGQQVGGFSFAPFSTERYEAIFFHAALIQGVGGGLVAGVMTEGHPLGGLKHSVIMTIVSWFFFRVFLG